MYENMYACIVYAVLDLRSRASVLFMLHVWMLLFSESFFSLSCVQRSFRNFTIYLLLKYIYPSQDNSQSTIRFPFKALTVSSPSSVHLYVLKRDFADLFLSLLYSQGGSRVRLPLPPTQLPLQHKAHPCPKSFIVTSPLPYIHLPFIFVVTQYPNAYIPFPISTPSTSSPSHSLTFINELPLAGESPNPI